MSTTATPTAPSSYRTRLLHAKSIALDTLLELAQARDNPAQARLAAAAILRLPTPDADEAPDDGAPLPLPPSPSFSRNHPRNSTSKPTADPNPKPRPLGPSASSPLQSTSCTPADDLLDSILSHLARAELASPRSSPLSLLSRAGATSTHSADTPLLTPISRAPPRTTKQR